MTRSEAGRSPLSRGRLFSSHGVLDDRGYVGIVSLFENAFHFAVRHRWSGRVLLDWWCHRSSPTWSALMPNWRPHVAKWVKRWEEAEKQSVAGGKLDDPAFVAAYPALYEHVSLDWLDGKRRETSTVGLSVEGGRWRIRLCDRDNGLVAFLTGDRLDDVLGALEQHLEDGNLDWREDQYARPAGKGKRR